MDALVLNHQGFRRLGPGDALVEGPGDLGVELAHLAVPVEDAGLEPARQRRHHRHDEDDHQRQPPVQGQHGRKAAQHVQHPPRHVRQVPGDVAGDAVGVVHHPGDEVAHRGDVVKGQGQGLQMAEKIPSHVPAQVHLHVHGPAGKAHHHQRLQRNGPQIGRRVGGQAVQRPPLDKVADGVLLEQGKDHVHQGGEAVDGHHQHNDFFVTGQDRQQPLPDLQVKGFGILFLVKSSHYAPPPFSTSARSSLLI